MSSEKDKDSKSSNGFVDTFNSTVDVIYKKFLVKVFQTIFDVIISILFVQIPIIFKLIITLGKKDEKREKEKRIRAKLTDESDPSSAYRAVEVIDKLENQPEKRVETLSFIPDLCLKRFPDKETMGVRQIIDVHEEKQKNGKIYKKLIMGDYQFITYRQACQRIDLIGQGILSIGGKIGENILIYSETRPEWLLTAFAAFRHGLPLVTLLSTLGEEPLKHIINESKVKIIVTSYELIPKIEKIFNQTKQVEYIVYFPPLAKPEEAKKPKDKNNIQFIPLEQLEEQGKHLNIDERILNARPDKKDTAVIMYTSGSTGTPKGVSLSHENIVAGMTGQKERVFPIIDIDNDIYIAYLPLAHILELSCEILVFYLGIKSGYSSPQTLTDQSTSIKRGDKGDLKVLRPHLMTCVPTILDRIHKTINEKINESNIFKRLLFNLFYKIKLKRLESGLNSPIIDHLLFSKLNQMSLGGQVKAMLCGGAVLAEETQRFAQAALCVTLFQGYGLTETCAAGTIADQYDITAGRTGYPLVSCEIRLIDWDEGQYKTTDKPNPRGEVLIGGKVVAQGYSGQTTKESENFKEINGIKYFSTGDIGEIFPDGTLKIIDRKKDLIKLSGGEYVSLNKVETAINKLSFVENCCLCASSQSDHTVLLISPKSKTKIQNDEQVLKEVQDVCRKDGIQQYEIPQAVKIVEENWTPDTGLVTEALKLKRKAIEQKYKDDIDQLYQGKSSKDNKTKSNKDNKENKTKDSKQNPTEDDDIAADDNDNKKDQ